MRRRLVIEQPVDRDDRKKDKRKAKRPAGSGGDDDQSPKQRAQELVENGMPYQMAMAVVHGKMELNEALERLSRRDRVNQMMERYDLSRALATQVAIGHADLKQILRRRRLKAHRAENRDRTCLVPDQTLTLARFGEKAQAFEVVRVEPYQVVLKPEEGDAVEVHKLALKYGYASDDWKRIRKALKKDKKLASKGLLPETQPQDRYTCSDKRLFGYVDSGNEVQVTLVDGDTFKGVVTWFSRYEFGLEVRGEVEVTVFRHALYDLHTT